MNQLMAYVLSLVESGEMFSDIQVETGKPVMWKLPNGWHETGYGVVAPEEINMFMRHIHENWKEQLQTGHSINRTLHFDNFRLRCCAYKVRGGEGLAATLRVLPIEAPDIGKLGLPIQVAQFASVPKGLLLVAGATGVGKTTTIASIVARINAERNAHIITIEEPIEFIHTGQKAIVTQREVGAGLDVKTYVQGVYEALRQCPDVIVIGEIRDTATAEAALYAAESGHYVMATVHAKSALGAIQKYLSFFPDESRTAKASMLAGTLCGVLFQTRLSSADAKSSVVASELLSSMDGEITSAIINPEKIRSVEDRFKAKQLKGAIHINESLSRLIESGKISKQAAIAASYCPEGLV